VGDGIGHFFGAMRVDAFRPADDFKKHMDNWIARFRRSKPIDSQPSVLIPGDPEREITKIRMRNGIPLNPKVDEDLRTLASRFSLDY
jgi:LDH2 family malate/lactate/ureidoglycolate dehydrogenase